MFVSWLSEEQTAVKAGASAQCWSQVSPWAAHSSVMCVTYSGAEQRAEPMDAHAMGYRTPYSREQTQTQGEGPGRIASTQVLEACP